MGLLISVPEVRINDELIRIVPNSVTYNGGEGEITVKTASAGSGNVESVHAENAETQIGMFKCSVYLDNDLDSKIRAWKRNVGTNEIKMTQKNNVLESTVRVWTDMSLAPAVDREASADGVTEIEFSGGQMVIQ